MATGIWTLSCCQASIFASTKHLLPYCSSQCSSGSSKEDWGSWQRSSGEKNTLNVCCGLDSEFICVSLLMLWPHESFVHTGCCTLMNHNHLCGNVHISSIIYLIENNVYWWLGRWMSLISEMEAV